ncbi:MAG: helix-turn-helix transcriptional regulator [Coprobacillus cateniformis]|uniref:helix-turn-helix transcriptional regulator n=1 Tax=Longibaculum muris TaxID=1796628 RepID=UPI003AB343E1|nr:helix-turn-helix transcriptional regulator [Coprobacillus cateniformis]
MPFSSDIKTVRKKLLLSQMDFAKEVGVSYTTINRLENGKAKPNYKTLKKIDTYCKKKVDFDIQNSI